MLRHSFHPVILAVFGLALIGIGAMLFTSPGAFFTRIFVAIGVLAVMIFVMRKFILPKLMNRQASYGQHPRAYANAGKKQPGKKQPASLSAKKKEKKKSVSRPLVKRQSDVKLTVIEGKKNKKKSRALF